MPRLLPLLRDAHATVQTKGVMALRCRARVCVRPRALLLWGVPPGAAAPPAVLLLPLRRRQRAHGCAAGSRTAPAPSPCPLFCSCMVRGYPPALLFFREQGGLAALVGLLAQPEPRLQRCVAGAGWAGWLLAGREVARLLALHAAQSAAARSPRPLPACLRPAAPLLQEVPAGAAVHAQGCTPRPPIRLHRHPPPQGAQHHPGRRRRRAAGGGADCGAAAGSGRRGAAGHAGAGEMRRRVRCLLSCLLRCLLRCGGWAVVNNTPPPPSPPAVLRLPGRAADATDAAGYAA